MIIGEDISIPGARYEGDKFIIPHHQHIAPILDACKKRRDEIDPRHRVKGEWERIAAIPEVEFLKRPELVHDTSGTALKIFLKSDEGKMYRTSRRSI